MTAERTAWWGTCEDCLTSVVIYPHPERPTDIPAPDEWESISTSCPVCDGGNIEWGGADPASDIIKGYS